MNSWVNTAATTCPKIANAKPGRAHASASARRTSTRQRCSPSGSTPSLASSPREDQAVLEELKKNGPPPGKTVGKVFDELRLNAMRRSGIDVEGLTDKDLRGSGTIHLFPNFLGPITHGNATLYRARPNGLDPDSTLLDYWALEWVPPDSDPKPIERKFYEDWTTKDWGLINNQDFANLAEATRGMKSKGYRGAMLNPVQEANLIHHHRVLDQYLSA